MIWLILKIWLSVIGAFIVVTVFGTLLNKDRFADWGEGGVILCLAFAFVALVIGAWWYLP